MKSIFCSLIIILFFSNIIFANSKIDTLNTLSYFPMQVGNQWQFSVTNSYYPNDTSYYGFSISGDTLMPNNKCYFEFDYGIFAEYFRIDSTELRVYTYDAYLDTEYVHYKLTLTDTDSIFTLYHIYDTTFGQVGNLPYYRTQNVYDWTDFYTEDQTIYLSKDFGLSTKIRDFGYGSISYYNLIAARIDSVMYGQFITSINQTENINNFILFQNYPNPFNQTTKIKFSLEKIENIRIEVYNTLGKKIEILLKEQLPAGLHEIEFNADKLASGVYLYRIEAGDYQQIRKMILLK